jgi:hypothetical protein
MDQKIVDELEHEIKEAIVDVICRLGLRKLPFLPSRRTMHMMAKAAVVVYEAAVETQGQGVRDEA